jgi:hypothetical protein
MALALTSLGNIFSSGVEALCKKFGNPAPKSIF